MRPSFTSLGSCGLPHGEPDVDVPSEGSMRRTWSMVASIVIASAVAVHGAEEPAPQDKILATLEAYAQTAQQQWNVPGFAIAVVKDDQVIYAKGFGVKRVGGTDPVDPDTVFQIGSTSKAFTAA